MREANAGRDTKGRRPSAAYYKGLRILRWWLTVCASRLRSWRTDTHVTRLGEGDIGKFFDLPGAVIPEAFQEHYASAALRRETAIQKGGCKGLQVR